MLRNLCNLHRYEITSVWLQIWSLSNNFIFIDYSLLKYYITFSYPTPYFHPYQAHSNIVTMFGQFSNSIVSTYIVVDREKFHLMSWLLGCFLKFRNLNVGHIFHFYDIFQIDRGHKSYYTMQYIWYYFVIGRSVQFWAKGPMLDYKILETRLIIVYVVL